MKERNLYLEEFRFYLLKNDKSKNTIKTYIENVNLFRKWFIKENDEEFIPKKLIDNFSE